ncbi:MAG: DUF3046 domain-containing protein [Actinomycetota bacterium]
MRYSEFWHLMADEFGAGYAQAVARGQAITGLGGQTVEEALAAQVPAREVWFALCEVMDVPAERRWGQDIAGGAPARQPHKR